jgi:hypothetical protein
MHGQARAYRSTKEGPTTLRPEQLADALVHLSVPIIRTLTTVKAAGPVCATHHYDFQLVPCREKMHVGPPAVGVEIELRGEERLFADQRSDPRGLVSQLVPCHCVC